MVRTATSDEVNLIATAIELRQIGLTPDPSGSPLRFTYAFSMKPQATIANTYSIVSKNLIEWAAVVVLIACRTGDIAGLDVLRRRR